MEWNRIFLWWTVGVIALGIWTFTVQAIDGESEVWAASLLALSTTQKSHLLFASCLFVLSESQSELAFRHIFPIKLEWRIWTQLSISFKVKSTNCMLIKVPVYLEIQGKIWPTNNSGLETFIWGSIDWGLTMYQGKHFPCTVSSNLANRQLVGYFYYLHCTHGVTETWKVE